MSGSETACNFDECGSQDLFTPEFKRLKARNPLPDFTGVTDLSRHKQASPSSDQAISRYPVRGCGLQPVAGVRPCDQWECYQFSDYPGLIIIQNPFVDGYQNYWVCQCLQNFPSGKDNVTNLTSLGDESSRNLWREFCQKKSSTFGKQDPLRKLCWTTLGYHYNWTTKEYSEANKAPFPMDVNCLAQYFAACLGFSPYQAEAAIINYYNLDSTLAGHTDHSELNHSAPLFSISFGQTAVFMLGGLTKSVKPVSVFLRSGDICVMSGSSRLAYHAVPKILSPSSSEPIPSCFKLPHRIHHASCNNTTSSAARGLICDINALGSAGRGYHADGVRRDACESNPVSQGSNCDIFSTAADPGRAEISPESEGSQNGCCGKNSSKQHLDSNIATRNNNVHDKKFVDSNSITDKECVDSNSTPDKECVEYFKIYNSNIDFVNSKIEDVIATLDFSPFEVYLKSSRINLNIRQVLPPGWTKLQNNHLDMSDNISGIQSDCLIGEIRHGSVENVCDYYTDMSTNCGGSEIVGALSRNEKNDPSCSEMEVTKKMKTDF